MSNFSRILRRPQDAVLLILWILLGLVPSALLFVWIERNCALPWIPQQLGFPWIIVDGSLTDWILFDIGLLLLFGVVHSLLAAPQIRDLIFAPIHPKNRRAVYVIFSGITAFIIFSHWQATGIVLYSVFSKAVTNTLISVLLFWTVMLVLLRASEPLGMLQYLGLRDLLSKPEEWNSKKGPETLVVSGAYARVRHPIYSLTLLAIILTPLLSLDRLLVFTVFLAYILVGYHLEERKLVRTFGPAYEEYRKKVPALFPRF